MSPYVVAGVTGRVGSTVAATLLSAGQPVRVLVRDEARGHSWLERGAEVSVGSLDDKAFLLQAWRAIRGAFVLLPENVASDDFHGARRRMADVMLSAVAAAPAEGGGPATDLHYLEAALQRTTRMVTMLRACSFQDNIAGLIPMARSAGLYPSFMPSPDLASPMIATRDVGRFAAEALLSPPAASEVVDLIGPAYSIRELAAKLGDAVGRPLQILEIPPAGHVAALVQAGMPQQLAEAVAEMFASAAAGAFVPKGDRRLIGTTTIDEVIAQYAGRPA
jgi:uncharacterized protein YbjT (DUF2867 family)